MTAAGPGLLVHCSTAEIGGAETSLLAAVAACAGPKAGPPPVFLLPAEGPLARAARDRGWKVRILPWPRGLSALKQGNWLALPLALPGLPSYLLRLRAAARGAETVWSSGVKSHAACLFLAPALGGRLRFDVRDFIRSAWLRKGVAFCARRFGARVTANSRAVAADYPGAEVAYPSVRLPRPPQDRRRADGRKVIAHLAYFAPYKGQDLFLEYARRILDAGVDAEFLVIGDVIYPAASYARYGEEVRALAARLGLRDRVRFVGKADPARVQELLEGTHLLLHCTREPEPFGRSIVEALLCGCEVICHGGSGACETAVATRELPGWMAPLAGILESVYVRLEPREKKSF